MLPRRQRLLMIRQVARLRHSPLVPAWRAGPGAGAAAGDGQTRVRVRAGRRCGMLTASVREITSPATARRHNLVQVATVLEAAEVPYFRVPHAQDQRTRIAVPDSWRDRALAALARSPEMACADIRGFTAQPVPRPVPLRDAPVARACWAVTNAARTMLLGDECACEIEFWNEIGESLVCPREPRVTPPVHRGSPVLHAPERDFDQFCAADDRGRYPTRHELLLAGMDWVRFPVDAVYTWVDGSDPRWQRRKAQAVAANTWATAHPEAANASRYVSRDELRYSLRSLYYFAPWIRRVFLVTDAQAPDWLDTDNGWVTVVDHREILGGAARLPTFNSHAIETRLHHIPGLAEHFLYLNDDVFLGRPQTPDQFFLPSGMAKFFPSRVHVQAGPVRPEDPPIMSSGKNNRAVVAAHFGRLLTQKMKHTPHPQRRSVLIDIEQQCAELIRVTSGHAFRHPEDISIPSSLQHYWSYLTGRAVPGQLDYQYTDLAHPLTPLRLMALLRHRHRDVFCLNDTQSTERDRLEQEALLGEFLPAYFPFPAPFERAPSRHDEPVELVAPPQSRRPQAEPHPVA